MSNPCMWERSNLYVSEKIIQQIWYQLQLCMRVIGRCDRVQELWPKIHKLTTHGWTNSLTDHGQVGAITQKPTEPDLLFLLMTHFIDKVNPFAKFHEANALQFKSYNQTFTNWSCTDGQGDYSTHSKSWPSVAQPSADHAIVTGKWYMSYSLSHIIRKPVFAICDQQRCRSACAFAQSDQHLCCSLLR